MMANLLNYIVWDPDPILFHLGPIALRYYATCWLVGLLLGYLLMQRLYRQQKIGDEKFEPLFIYIFIGILAGARLGHCLFYQPEYFLSQWDHVVEMLIPMHHLPDGSWKFTGYEGLASHGGVIGMFVAIWLYCRNLKVKGWVVLDNMGICSGIAAAFIRIGNLMNSEIIGKVTDVPWAFIFVKEDQYPRHPGQLYEAIAYLIIFLLIFFIYKKKGPKSVGSGGSRLTTGTLPLHNQLETALASFKHTEKALIFNTGYMANVGIISALGIKDSIIFSDELNHASIIDGCRLSHAKTVVYKHNDMKDLAKKLQEHAGCQGLIVTDAVFSMGGDIAPLPDIMALAKQYHVLTMVDEAHATGVIGATGRGIAEHFGLKHQPDVLMGTLSKALAAEGGYVCGSQLLIDYLRNTARSYIFSTSLSPAVLAAATKALELLENQPSMVHQLQENTRIFCKTLQQKGIEAHSDTAIVPIVLHDEELALRVAEELNRQNIFISPIRYPTVPKGQAMLRAALMATHTPEELCQAAHTIGQTISRLADN